MNATLRGRGGRLWVWYLCAEAGLYAAFLALDLFRPASWLDVPLKYLSILLCLLFSLTLPPAGERWLLSTALAFTLLADAFLLVLDRHYLLGVASFCVVQALYCGRILWAGGRPVWPGLLLRALLAAAALALLRALGALDALTALTGVYFTQLLANALGSLRLVRRGRRYALFAAGLLLFVGCDVCVGLQNLSSVLPAGGAGPLLSFARVGMWLFYLPSQVLITLSARDWARKT